MRTRLLTSALALCLVAGPLRAQEAAGLLRKGDKLAQIEAGGQVFRGVVVRSFNARTVTFLHEGGLASLPLRELAPELQRRFGYTPEAESAAEQALAEKRAREEQRQREALAAGSRQRQDQSQQRYVKLLEAFLKAPELHREIDLRPKFVDFDLAVKSQGRRPSCAIFSIVGALEFLNAELTGKPERLSEEYLLWATRSLVESQRGKVAAAENADLETADVGFDLREVMMALRGFGIPLQSSMPNTFGKAMSDIAEPPREVVEEARRRAQVFIHAMPGRERVAALPNLVHTLNAGIPVPIGLRWPHYATLRSGYLSDQVPMKGYAHAVTLVGYQCRTGKLEDVVFIFRNSYGCDWGQNGYGFVTFAYLGRHMLSAALLELQLPAPAGAALPAR